VQQVHGSKKGAESWEFSLSSWVGGFCLLLLAGCGETALKLGSGDKYLCYALNKLFGFTLSILFTSQALFGVFGWLGPSVRLLGQVATAWVVAAVSRPSGFILIDLFSVFRWLDGLVAVVSL